MTTRKNEFEAKLRRKKSFNIIAIIILLIIGINFSVFLYIGNQSKIFNQTKPEAQTSEIVTLSELPASFNIYFDESGKIYFQNLNDNRKTEIELENLKPLIIQHKQNTPNHSFKILISKKLDYQIVKLNIETLANFGLESFVIAEIE